MFEYSVDYSLSLNEMFKNIDTVVTTDCDIIIDYCSNNDIKCIDRDRSLATSHTRIEHVIRDAYEKLERDYKYVSLLYANLPTRYISEFIRAHTFLEKNVEYDCVMSMKKMNHLNPEFMFEFNEDILPKLKTKIYRWQDVNKYMTHDAHTILFRYESLNTDNEPQYLYEQFGKKIKPMFHTNIVVDIDTQEDFDLAGRILR